MLPAELEIRLSEKLARSFQGPKVGFPGDNEVGPVSEIRRAAHSTSFGEYDGRSLNLAFGIIIAPSNDNLVLMSQI
jgi:hypothetical protein